MRSNVIIISVAAVLAAGTLTLATATSASAAPETTVATVRTCATPAAPGFVACLALKRTDIPASDGPGNGLGPADLASAYHLPASTSTQTVAVIDAYDNPNAAADLAAYRYAYGQPALRAGQFRKVNQNGQASPLPAADTGWAAQSSVDIEMVSAVCPSCNILLVEADSTSVPDVGVAVNRAVALGAKYVSNSYAGPEYRSQPVWDSSYFDHRGVVVTAGTGDNGYGVSYPASAPDVVAVGGTSLNRSAGSRGWSETAWAGSGSGCSAFEAQPDLQQGVTSGCPSNRAVADLAAVADPGTGVAVYQSGSGWGVYGGTGVSSPIIAAVYALASNPVDAPLTLPYGHPAELNDVTTGTSGTCAAAALCNARAGWDGPTGLGTPNGTGAFGGPATVTPVGATAGQYVALTPTRVMDTRNTRTPLGPNTTRTLDLKPYLPSQANAVVVNLTSTDNTADGYLTLYPDGAARPVASNLNKRAGITRANSSTVVLPASASNQRMNIYNASGSTSVIVDLLGYYSAGVKDTRPGSSYYPLVAAARQYDSRGDRAGPLTNRAGNNTAYVDVGFTNGNRTATGITALAINLTAVDPAGQGFLTAWNGNAARVPGVSTVNFAARQTIPNFAVVPTACLDTNCSRVRIAVRNYSASSHVIVDVVGFYAAPRQGTGTVYQGKTPYRIVDTRSGKGFGRLTTAGSASVGVGSSTATAANLNVTAVNPAAQTYLTLYPTGSFRPTVSNLNPARGETAPNAAQIRVSQYGFTTYNNSGGIDIAIDVEGLFFPELADSTYLPYAVTGTSVRRG